MAATSEPESHLADHINSCIPFYDLIEKNVREGVGNRSTTLTSQTLVAAYAFRDYSVVTNDLEGAYGKRKFCRYLDINFNEIGKPVESFIFPDFVVFCCRNPEAVYMSITDDTDSGFEDNVRILDRTIEEPIYELSICLGTLRDGTSYWLMLAELIEHHKLVGVQHFYIYVKDIDEYSEKVLVMAIHNAQLYFPGFDHGITISSKEIVIRHYRDVTIDDWSVRVLPFVEKFGVFENTTYPERLAGKLLHNVQQRLDRVYGNDRFAIASLEAV
ncbi:unnamed protein product [Nippostrongylus brasiliensis]|uniref:Glycosyltransferase family 92 protein n=1 Tax=Nippostrongylus brasiliensis TaxID=27835 RepID=A0A158R028_NIPBR|nr:unnamed protein product [Nippostrongylus brasiliensis]